MRQCVVLLAEARPEAESSDFAAAMGNKLPPNVDAPVLQSRTIGEIFEYFRVKTFARLSTAGPTGSPKSMSSRSDQPMSLGSA